MRGDRRIQPYPRRAGHERSLYCHASVGHGGGHGCARRPCRDDRGETAHGESCPSDEFYRPRPATRRTSKQTSTRGELITAVVLPAPAGRQANLSESARPGLVRLRSGLRRRGSRRGRRQNPQCADRLRGPCSNAGASARRRAGADRQDTRQRDLSGGRRRGAARAHGVTLTMISRSRWHAGHWSRAQQIVDQKG